MFLCEKAKILPHIIRDVITQRYQNLYTTNGLSILMYGTISLPDLTSYD